MSRAHAVSLSDQQPQLVQQYAASLPVQLRDRYLKEIAHRLFGEPTDTAVMAAINLALDRAHSFLNQGGLHHAHSNPHQR